MNAGDAIIYDHRLFHGSPANRSSELRIAINYAMIPNELNSWHLYLDNNKINAFEVDDEFYLNCTTHEPFDMSPFKKVETIELKSFKVQQSDIAEWVQ